MPKQLTDEDLGLSSSTSGLSDADLGLDTAVLPQAQMAEAANTIPRPDTFNPSALGLATLPPLPLGYTGTPIQSAAGTISLPEARHQMFQELKPSPRTVQNAFDVIDAYSGGAVSEPGVEPFTPPQIQEQLALPDQPISREAKVTSGLVGGGLNLAETFSTPEGAALMFSGGIPGAIGKLVNAGFFADMIRQAPQVYQNLGAAFGSGDTAKITEALVDAVAHGLFTIGTGHGAIPDRLTIRRAVEQMSPEQRAAIETQVKSQTPGEQNAIPIRSPETLPMGESPKDSREVGARVPEPKASAETQSGEPSPAQPAETAPSEISLRPAIRGQGQIVEGTLGKSHGDLITDATKSGDPAKIMAAIAGRSEGSGFVGPDGEFRTRKEAEAQMKEQYGDFEMIKPAEGLHSEDLNAEGKPKLLKPEVTITDPKASPQAKVYAAENLLKKVQNMTPEQFVALGDAYKKQTGVKRLTQLSYDIGDALAKSGRDDLVDAFRDAYQKSTAKNNEMAAAVMDKISKMPRGPEADAVMKPVVDLATHPQFFNEVVQRAEWIKSGGVEHAGRFKGETVPKWAKPAEVASPQIAKTQTETPLPADVAPAYEHGHAVASNVPGLLIDPFGFQAAKIVGKAAKDLYDSPAVKKARQDVADLWNAAALKSAPKLTRSNRQLGEAGVRYASSFMVGRTKGQIFADKVLADSKIDPVKFGTALAEDNLRSIRAARDPAQAAKVRTLVGDETSPFKTEAEYQTFLNDPATKAAIERHQQLWAEQKDPLYRQANDLDPDLPLETRGMQTGARINLKALQSGEAGVAPIGQRAPGFRQLATLKRRDPFGRQAKGSGLAYEGNYHEIMANGFERELPVAAQHEFLKQLIDNGDAIVTDKMVEPELELKGEGTAKGYLLTLKPYTGKFIHVRKGLADEFEAISGLDKPLKLPIITAFNNFMTRQSVAGLAEGATHASNLMTQIFTMPGPTGNPMLNALLKSVGRADLLVSVPRVFIKAFTNQRERMLELAEIGAAKEPYPGAIAKKILNPIDQGVRLVSDDVFKALAKKGIVESTETNRREFINQVGQYNKRLQPLLTRKLRETGLQPFITAAQTFNAQGARRLVMGPGAKATNNARALALKADVAAGWIGGIVLVTALNLLLSKNATGPVGTPLGSVGWIGDDKKVHTFNVFRLLGYERGARITGLGPYIEAKRQGLSSGQALTSGAQSVASTGLGMAMGPGPRFAMVAGTGQRPTQPWVREAPRVPPSDSLSPLKSQIAKNIQTAMVEANPILSSVAEVRKEVKQGKPLSEALVGGAQKQLTRYSPQTRMSEQKAAALPKIVDSAQLRDYVDDVVKEARQLPMRERQHFINQKFRDDELGRKYRDAAWQQIERKGVLKYK